MNLITGLVSKALLASLVALAGWFALAGSAGAATWTTRQVPFVQHYPGQATGGPLLGISCPTRSFCLAGGVSSRLAVSSNPTAGAGGWEVFDAPEGSDYNGPPPPPGAPPNMPHPNVQGVSCPSPSLCVAVSGNGDIYTSTDPMAGTAAWVRADVDGPEFDTHLEGVSCPTVSFCVAVSGGVKQNNNPLTSGKIVSSHNPTGGASAWQVTQLDPSFDLRGVSCGSPSLCVAVGRDGRMVVSTEPDGPPSAWRDAGTPGGPGHLQGVACSLSGLCVAGNSSGNLLTDLDPGASPGSWAERNGGGSVPITGISCPTSTRCAAVDDNGDVLTSTDPAGGAGSWTFANVLPYVETTGYELPLNGMFGISCPSSAFCAIAAAEGQILTSTDPFGDSPSPARQGGQVRRPKRPRVILAHVDARSLRTKRARIKVRFRFYVKGQVRGFVCKLDRRPYRACHSPLRVWADQGRHVFRVRAIGATGLKGPVALDRFRVLPPFPHV